MFVGAALDAEFDLAVVDLVFGDLGALLGDENLADGPVGIGEIRLRLAFGLMLMPEQTMSIFLASRAGMMPSQSIGLCSTVKPIFLAIQFMESTSNPAGLPVSST